MKVLLNLAPLALAFYTIRLLITGASVGDSLTIIGLSALYAFFLFLESKKQIPVNKDLWDRLIEVEEKLGKHQESISSLNVKTIFNKK
jgi:hypothetical protein